MCSSISNMSFSRVPCARRMVEACEEYMSDIGDLSPGAALSRGRARGGGIEPDDDDRYIVCGSPVQRQADQQVAGSLRRVVPGERQDFLVFNVGGKPIAADHENVAVLQRSVGHFQFEIVIGSNRPGNDVASKPGPRLF